MPSLLEIRDLHFHWPEQLEIFSGLNCSIQSGQRIALLGRNGSGKSTLFRLMMGLSRPTAGELAFEGESYRYGRKDLESLRKKIGFVFQDPEHQLFAPNVLQELAFGLLNSGYSDEAARERVLGVAEHFQLLPLLERGLHELSFGEKKRVSIAAILALQPSMLILDEPTAWLDPENRDQVTDLLLSESRERGTTLLVSSHQLQWAAHFAERAILLGGRKDPGSAAQIVFDGPMAELMTQTELLAREGLLSRYV